MLEKAVVGRPISVSGGVSFSPCGIGANHCRLPHLGWKKSGHWLTSRRWDTSSIPSLDELLPQFRYPAHSGLALLDCVLPSRYCTALFSDGHVADLITEVVRVLVRFMVLHMQMLILVLMLRLEELDTFGLENLDSWKWVRPTRKLPADLVHSW